MTELSSERVHEQIDELLLRGVAASAHEAEAMFLDAHLPEIAQLALDLSPEEFAAHEAVKLLMAHGSRRFEDDSR